MPGYGLAGFQGVAGPTADFIARLNDSMAQQFAANANYESNLQDRNQRGWLASEQIKSLGENRTMLMNLLGLGAGQGGAGTGQAFGGPASQLFQDNLADVSNMGQGEQNRINQRMNALSNTTAARLEARGLGGSNLVSAAQSNVERERSSQMLDLNDRLAGQRVGVRGQEMARQTSILQSLLGQLGSLDLNFDLG
jgi:hypothetical protein